MKTKTLSFLASLALLSFASCTDEVQELANEPLQTLKQIVMTTQDFQPEAGSRTLYEIGEAIKCTWAANDTVGVFPEKGAQAYFPMASGAGTKNATFDGEGWALKDGKTYGAYYPCIGEFYLDRNAVPVSYVGQTQTGNASTAHLGAYDYMVAAPTTSEFGSAQFTFKHLSALIQLRITVPQPTTFTSVKLVADTEAFAVKGEVDIMADAPGITSTKTAKEIVLNLQDVATTEENQVVTLYMMLPSTDLSGQTLKAVVATDLGTQETVLEGRNFKAGTAYGLSGKMESTGPGYRDGVVTIVEAGTMKKLLGDDYLNITSLKIVGPINGDDVYCLRKMLGASSFSGSQCGKLTTLDLSKASIVEGGEWYYEDQIHYYTHENSIGLNMFRECVNLQEIVLPSSVTGIGDDAFKGCSSLISIDIPNGVTYIGWNAFEGCSSLISINIPFGLTTIWGSVFQDCSSLTSIYIPNSVTTIAQFAFDGCSSLTSVNFGAGVTTISSCAFRGCSSLQAVNIADLSAWCNIEFSNDSSNPLCYGPILFLNYNELTELVIPEDVKQIKDYAFYGYKRLPKVTIGDGVTSIGNYAFYGCSSLASVTIGNGITSIGNSTFNNCSSLKDFYCYATTPPTINSYYIEPSFPYYGEKTTLHVPERCLSKYQSSDWAECFKTIVEME